MQHQDTALGHVFWQSCKKNLEIGMIIITLNQLHHVGTPGALPLPVVSVKIICSKKVGQTGDGVE